MQKSLWPYRLLFLFFSSCISLILSKSSMAFLPGERMTTPQEMQTQTRTWFTGTGFLLSPEASTLSRQFGILHSQTLFKNEKWGSQLSAKTSHWNFTPPPGTHVNEHNPIPSLNEMQWGGNIAHLKQNGDHIWGSVHLQSSSDKVFHSRSETEIQSTMSYSFKKRNFSQWTLLMHFSSRRAFLPGIPLPGFLYHYSPHSDFRLIAGVPILSVFWRFHPQWNILYFGIAPWQSRAILSYTLFGPFSLGLGSAFQQNHFLLADRKDKREQLYYDERKYFLTLRAPLNKFLFFELEGGSLWRRRFFFARRYSSSPARPISLGNAVYVSTQLSVRYE